MFLRDTRRLHNCLFIAISHCARTFRLANVEREVSDRATYHYSPDLVLGHAGVCILHVHAENCRTDLKNSISFDNLLSSSLDSIVTTAALAVLQRPWM